MVVNSITADPNSTDLSSWTKRETTCSNTAGDPNGPASIGANPESDGNLGAGQALQLGPYPDGNAYSNVKSHALDGVALKDITELKYDSLYHDPQNNGGPGNAAPDLRLFLGDTSNPDDVIFSENTGDQLGKAKPDAWQTWNVVDGSVRYNDDEENGPDESWADLIAAHGDEKVVGLSNGGGLVLSGGCSIANGATDYYDNLQVAAGGQKITFDFGG